VCLNSQERFTAVFFVYGDDSSDEKKERVLAIGVVIGTEENWKPVESKWELRNGGIPFHAKDCESDWGDFQPFTHQENKQRYRDMTTILVESELGGFGASIDLAAQNRLFPGSLEHSYFRAFSAVLQQIKWVSIKYNEVSKFAFDINVDQQFNAAYLYESVRKNDPEALSHFDPAISFAPAREYPRLQAADLMAFEAMKALDNTIGPKPRRRGSWEALRATERFEVHSFSEDWFAGLKRELENLESGFGYTREDYRKWLKDTNRQDNVSNRYYFTNMMWEKDKSRIRS
jgi:hypothetical protein